MADVHVTGLSDLLKVMEELPAKVERNVLRGGLRSGMNVVKPVAQSNIHSVSGALAKALKVGTVARGGEVKSYLHASQEDYIARFVEFGTKPHFISVQEAEKPINTRLSIKRGKIVRASMTTVNRNVLKIGSRFVGKTVFHPGASPKPFMRPALDTQSERAVIAMGEYVRNRLETKEGLNAAHIRIEGDE